MGEPVFIANVACVAHNRRFGILLFGAWIERGLK